MRKLKPISVITAALLVFSLFASGNNKAPKKTTMPSKVKAAIEKSCLGCHNNESRNEDAKEALNFDKFENLSRIKKISAYKEIGETIEEEEMPPKRFIKKYPNRELTKAEKAVLLKWTEKQAKKLVKGI